MADFMRRCTRQRVTAFAMASVLVATSTPLHAGDLNTEVNNMFNNLGAIGNYTAPGAFRGQTFNTYTGGNLMMRSPNKVYQLAAIQFPSAKAGCGGIDVFGGSSVSYTHLDVYKRQEWRTDLGQYATCGRLALRPGGDRRTRYCRQPIERTGQPGQLLLGVHHHRNQHTGRHHQQGLQSL